MAISAPPEAVRSWPDTVPDETRTLGWPILQWTLDNLVQPDGPNAGSTWQYTIEQVRIVLRWYEIDDEGRFKYRRGVLRRMKGWGKSPFLASLAAVELCGPCRFGGWEPDGKPIAVPHPAPWIQIAAVNKDQTRNTMTVFPGLFSKAAIGEYDVDLGKEIIHARGGQGRIEVVTSSPKALEGGRPSWVIADETQHWLPSTAGPEMMAAIRRNLGKSRDGAARVMEITNAHLTDEGSVAEATYEAWRASDGKLEGVLYDAAESASIFDAEGQHVPLKDWTDAQVRDALIAARGDSTWLDLGRILAEIRDPTSSESHSRRFYLNQVWSAANEEWLPVGAWSARQTDATIADGSDVILAVDGSRSDDSTGLVIASTGQTPHLEVVECWEKPPDEDGWRVPIDDVEATIRATCKKYRVREVVFDPYLWTRTMQALQKEGLPIVEYPQTPERTVPATQRFQTAVINGLLTHSGDKRLARHVGNVVVRESTRGIRIVKETKWSPRKIDLAVAAVMAHDRAASRPRVGAGWLQYLKNELAKDGVAAPVANAAEQPAPAAISPRDYFKSDVAVTRPMVACSHRWQREAWGTYCLHCQVCGEHPYNDAGVCTRCNATRD